MKARTYLGHEIRPAGLGWETPALRLRYNTLAEIKAAIAQLVRK